MKLPLEKLGLLINIFSLNIFDRLHKSLCIKITNLNEYLLFKDGCMLLLVNRGLIGLYIDAYRV